MSQQKILEIIQKEPGIRQDKIYKRTDICRGSVNQQIQRLVNWNEIYKVAIKRTYRLYPVQVR